MERSSHLHTCKRKVGIACQNPRTPKKELMKILSNNSALHLFGNNHLHKKQANTPLSANYKSGSPDLSETIVGKSNPPGTRTIE